MLRVKQLTELEEDKDLGIPTRFKKRYTKGCYNAAIKRYFLINKVYILIELYQKWYRQRKNNKQEDFYMWLDKKVILDQPIIKKAINYIKGALIIILKDLKNNQRTREVKDVSQYQ